MQPKWIQRIVLIAAVLAWFVVMLGAYTRLTDAGLGCPDWPGCYGHLVLPGAGNALSAAQANYPQLPIESGKAWTEMMHRYAAGTLALLIFITAFFVRNRLSIALVLLVLFQAALGMWTVTLKLLPVVVMAHLLGGILIFSCLSRLNLELRSCSPRSTTCSRNPAISLRSEILGPCEQVVGRNKRADSTTATWRPWLRLGALIVFLQIALGGWVSANYAGVACIGFPQCNGVWWPHLHLASDFFLFSPVGANYQGGVLDSEARMAIQFIHRLGAAVTLIYLLALTSVMMRKLNHSPLRLLASLAMVLVTTQVLLGIVNVIFLLPIGIAVAHNGVAALLMATMLMMLYLVRRPTNASY